MSPAPAIRADAALERNSAVNPGNPRSKRVDLEPPAWGELVVAVQAARIATSAQDEHPKHLGTLPAGGLTLGAERSPAVLRECADQIARGKEVFDALLSEWQARIENDPITRRALEGLSRELCRQLAALVFDTCTDLEIYATRKNLLTRVKKLGQEADRRRRMLNRKAKHARTALTSLRDYAAAIDSQIGEPYRRIASLCLQQVEPLCNNPAGPPDGFLSAAYWRELYLGLSASRATHPTPDDPAQDNMIKLYGFFVHGCRLTGDEAEVRTGLVRNTFWKDWTKAVSVSGCYTTGESMGCSAVHLAVQRSKA